MSLGAMISCHEWHGFTTVAWRRHRGQGAGRMVRHTMRAQRGMRHQGTEGYMGWWWYDDSDDAIFHSVSHSCLFLYLFFFTYMLTYCLKLFLL